MKWIKKNLSYSNMVATVALFVALGGVSYAAVNLPRGSVDTPQLANGAVSTRKIQDGAITSSKISDGAVTGAKVDVSTLGEVPDAVHASQASQADLATQANVASRALSAENAANASLLGGLQPNAYGETLRANTEVPATSSNAVWWIPVEGLGQPQSIIKDAEMVVPGPAASYVRDFTVHSRTGPGEGDAATVKVQLFSDEEPLVPSLGVGRLSWAYWGPSQVWKVNPGTLVIKVVEEPNGEEIPAMLLQTAFHLTPAL
jgi:hypothetical protein